LKWYDRVAAARMGKKAQSLVAGSFSATEVCVWSTSKPIRT
jgi:hypothetical protein